MHRREYEHSVLANRGCPFPYEGSGSLSFQLKGYSGGRELSAATQQRASCRKAYLKRDNDTCVSLIIHQSIISARRLLGVRIYHV